MNNFTNNDYRKIQAWLKANAVKDSELEAAKAVSSLDTLTIVQNGQSKKLTFGDVKSFINKNSLSKLTLSEYNSLPKKEINHIYLITDTNQIIIEGKAYGFSVEDAKKLNTLTSWYESVTVKDTDNIINKWHEIVNFLEGISDERTLTAIIEVFNNEISNIKEGKTIAGKAVKDSLGNIIHDYYMAKKDMPDLSVFNRKLSLGDPIVWSRNTETLLPTKTIEENTIGKALIEGKDINAVGTYIVSEKQEDDSLIITILANNCYGTFLFFPETNEYRLDESSVIYGKSDTYLSGIINLASDTSIKGKQALLKNTDEIIYCIVGDTTGVFPSVQKAVNVSSNSIKLLQYSSPDSNVNIMISKALDLTQVQIPSIGVNVGDIIGLTRTKVKVKHLETVLGIEIPELADDIEIELYQYKILSTGSAKGTGYNDISSGVMGLMSPEDKDLLIKIPDIEDAINSTEKQLQPITQAEYDNLVAEDKLDNRLYFIIES